MGYEIRKAAKIGRGHLRKFINCQDAHSLYQGIVRDQQVAIGIICDGCSEGTHSEVGARLASEFLVREALGLLQKGVGLDALPEVLYGQLLEFLSSLLHSGYDFVSQGDEVNFIKNQLLFTVVGFVITESDVVIFTAGDGTIVVNGEVTLIKQGGKPTYPAYHLVHPQNLKTDTSTMPTTFVVMRPERSTLKKLAIGSDSWHDEPDLLSKVWDFTSHPSGLQRQVNIWHDKGHHFEDDVTIITLEIVRPPEEVEAPVEEEIDKEERQEE